ncbi:DUF3089 domain-containing protein [Sphingomonas sabuli]|uniref:DUF3089 domain-containing protein n=1 Tax=Sphingomonas sabuli TaxID=2764186 RepID=A0A7G9L109_9SPHN|nr:DUF3089 domain-containing protein [Sphingomonas sabuli]QNM82308.1 DUF3089 domain-containing protein [Sphingomonas sabuli]
MEKFITGVIAALSPAQPANAQAAPVPPPDYAVQANWLCLPGRKDACSDPLPTTALTAAGYGSNGQVAPARNAPVDCFYVYPTMSGDSGLNSDLVVREEIGAVKSQFARFASVCRPFAPVYRQMTLGAVAASAFGSDIKAAGELAYADVARAWRAYLANSNKGRPFVLIGHSQGSLMLQELIKREIEGKPIARQMVRAILPGYNTLVPQGRTVGGTFQSTPICTTASQRGCVMSWVSFRDGNPPPDAAMFGWSAAPGMTVACTNPASPGSTVWQPLDSYWYTRSTYPVPGGPIAWSSEGPPPTAYVRAEGLTSGKCVTNGRRGYLSLRTATVPGSKRTSRIGGEVGIGGMFLPGWGMHLADMSVAQGDLLRQIAELSAPPRTAVRP